MSRDILEKNGFRHGNLWESRIVALLSVNVGLFHRRRVAGSTRESTCLGSRFRHARASGNSRAVGYKVVSRRRNAGRCKLRDARWALIADETSTGGISPRARDPGGAPWARLNEALTCPAKPCTCPRVINVTPSVPRGSRKSSGTP